MCEGEKAKKKMRKRNPLDLLAGVCLALEQALFTFSFFDCAMEREGA